MIHRVYHSDGDVTFLCDECYTHYSLGGERFHARYHNRPGCFRSLDEVVDRVNNGEWDIPTWPGYRQHAFTITELY